jgi:hypothetical protein
VEYTDQIPSPNTFLAFEQDRSGTIFGTPYIRESWVPSLMACVEVLGLKTASNKVLFPTHSNMEVAKVTEPKWLVVIPCGRLGEGIAARAAADPNRITPEETLAHFACDRFRPYALRRSSDRCGVVPTPCRLCK